MVEQLLHATLDKINEDINLKLHTEDDYCSVCFELMMTTRTHKGTIRLTCGHIFHLHCVLDICAVAGKTTPLCPLCRQEISFESFKKLCVFAKMFKIFPTIDSELSSYHIMPIERVELINVQQWFDKSDKVKNGLLLKLTQSFCLGNFCGAGLTSPQSQFVLTADEQGIEIHYFALKYDSDGIGLYVYPKNFAVEAMESGFIYAVNEHQVTWTAYKEIQHVSDPVELHDKSVFKTIDYK